MRDELADLLQPDVLSPAQYWAGYSRKNNLSPEKHLMLAVLEEGIACFQKYLLQRDRRFHEAAEWILEKDDDWPFSFENICETLELSPSCIRQALMRWQEKEAARHCKRRVKSTKRSGPSEIHRGRLQRHAAFARSS
jgi:hypothetical protein